MPISHTIDQQTGVIYRTVTGSITTVELIESFTNVLGHPDYRPGMKSLTDLRSIDHFSSIDDVKQIAQFMDEHQDHIMGGKAAVVVSRDVSFGMVRMLELLSSKLPIEIRVFRKLKAAYNWLDIPIRE